jgi:hypothetical protein
MVSGIAGCEYTFHVTGTIEIFFEAATTATTRPRGNSFFATTWYNWIGTTPLAMDATGGSHAIVVLTAANRAHGPQTTFTLQLAAGTEDANTTFGPCLLWWRCWWTKVGISLALGGGAWQLEDSER